jgi:myo-inositol catabolism protein IolC
MLNSDRVYMLAADHRSQWEEWCGGRGVPRSRIAEAKRLALDGFVDARSRSSLVHEFGALLLDDQYSRAVIADAVAQGIVVGTPAEKAGAFPLEWATEPFSDSLTGSFVKVLIRDRPDDVDVHERQLEKLLALQTWCEREQKPLVVEMLVGRRDEPADRFDATGRPEMIAAIVRDAYRQGLTPAFWKIEGTLDREGARIIDRAVAEHPDGRQIILGKAADLKTVARWFEAASESATAAGFAIGRTVFWDASASFLEGTLSAASATRHIADRYLQLVDTWPIRKMSY